MKKTGMNYRTMIIFTLAFAIAFAQGVSSSKAEPPSFVGAGVEANLSSEEQALDRFVSDLTQYVKQCRESSKKARLTRAEFEALQSTANGLRSRLSGVQNTLRDIVRKLKAANQWDNFDQLLLAKVPDTEFQNFVRRESFKKALDDAANDLSSDANEISSPLDTLRPKVSAAERNGFQGESNLAALTVRVAYQPAAPNMFASLHCRLAKLRKGISGFVLGKRTKAATENEICACEGLCDAT